MAYFMSLISSLITYKWKLPKSYNREVGWDLKDLVIEPPHMSNDKNSPK